jgi:hypothetical protein
MVGSLKMNTTLEYSTRVVQEGDRRCKKSTLNDLAYLTPLRIPLMNPVIISVEVNLYNIEQHGSHGQNLSSASTQTELLHSVSQQFYHS